MRIQLISKDNGLGLTTDVQVLRTAIEKAAGAVGREVTIHYADWQALRTIDGGRYDLSIHLELVSRSLWSTASRNIYVPNPEWYFNGMWGDLLPRFDEVWAKTEDCLRIFKPLHKRVVKSGWTSRDRYAPNVERIKSMIHVAGGSDAKGTMQVLQAMARHPELRLCLVVRTADKFREVPANVTRIIGPANDELDYLLNVHMVHLCPSSYEGFGHYINEARSVAAFIITTNAPPMNELVSSSYGALVAAASSSRMRLADAHHVHADALADAIGQVMACGDGVLARLGGKARMAYLEGAQEFQRFVDNAIFA